LKRNADLVNDFKRVAETYGGLEIMASNRGRPASKA